MSQCLKKNENVKHVKNVKNNANNCTNVKNTKIKGYFLEKNIYIYIYSKNVKYVNVVVQ